MFAYPGNEQSKPGEKYGRRAPGRRAFNNQIFVLASHVFIIEIITAIVVRMLRNMKIMPLHGFGLWKH